MYLEKICSICFHTKKARVKCWWNWLLQVNFFFEWLFFNFYTLWKMKWTCKKVSCKAKSCCQSRLMISKSNPDQCFKNKIVYMIPWWPPTLKYYLNGPLALPWWNNLGWCLLIREFWKVARLEVKFRLMLTSLVKVVSDRDNIFQSSNLTFLQKLFPHSLYCRLLHPFLAFSATVHIKSYIFGTTAHIKEKFRGLFPNWIILYEFMRIWEYFSRKRV